MKNLTNEQVIHGLAYKTANLLSDLDDNFTELDTEKAPVDNPTFTGIVAGITKAMVGLGNVDNTSDLNKVISILTQAALDLKANIASPTFTGVPAAPTAALGTATTQLATTSFVVNEIGTGTTAYKYFTDGVAIFREGVRSILGTSYFVLDQTITGLGFAGLEDTDWGNIRTEKLP